MILCLQQKYDAEKQLHILDRLAWSETFETFLENKYGAAKRFGLEGCETLIPGMKALIDRAADEGVRSVVIGMPHRGELSYLSSLFFLSCFLAYFLYQPPYQEILKDWRALASWKSHSDAWLYSCWATTTMYDRYFVLGKLFTSMMYSLTWLFTEQGFALFPWGSQLHRDTRAIYCWIDKCPCASWHTWQ